MKIKGQILVVVLVFLSVVLILTLAVFSLVAFFTRNATVGFFTEQALHLAEAGVDKAVLRLNQLGSSYTGETNTAFGAGAFTITIRDVAFGIKEITSIGFVPNSTNPQAKKTVKVKVTTGTQTIAFRYAVQVGEGGLTMDSNSIVNGNVYSNGNITGVSASKINGDAYAVGTISSPTPIVSGTRNPGAASQPMPEFDAEYWKGKANKKNDPFIGNCVVGGAPAEDCSDSGNLGPRKIEGDLTVSSNSSLTLTGPIHVTGNFTMNSNTDLYIDSSFASDGTVMVMDGKITLTSNARIHTTTSLPKGYIILASTKNDTVNPVQDLSSNTAAGVFYALQGLGRLSSNSHVTALVAYKLHLDSISTLDYDSGLASANFSAGPGGVWEISPGTYKIEN